MLKHKQLIKINKYNEKIISRTIIFLQKVVIM